MSHKESKNVLNFKVIFKCTLLFLSIANCKESFGQPENNYWFFGYKCGISFQTGVPTILPGSNLTATEGTAGISDSSGNLLFYTNGQKVMNKNHSEMPNGYGLFSTYTSTQAALIVKKPSSENLYYVFTSFGSSDTVGFSYSIVDMNEDNGMGDVIIKNVKLKNQISEKLTAVKHCNKVDYWVLIHDNLNNKFYSYKLTQNGLSEIFTASAVGNDYSKKIKLVGGYYGYMKASPNGKKIACAVRDTLQVFDFNNSNGQVTNPISISFTNPVAGIYSYIYGLSFSPDSRLLYVSSYAQSSPASLNPGCAVTQFDFSLGNSNDILASKFIVAINDSSRYALQLGPDKKIYIARPTENALGVINNPNQLGQACNYDDNVIDFISPFCNCHYGLPNNIDATEPDLNETIINTFLPKTISTCKYPVDLDAGIRDKYLWSNGDTTQTISVNQPGLYWVEQWGNFCNALVKIDTSIVIDNNETVKLLPNDTVMEPDGTLALSAVEGYTNYTWSNGEMGQHITIKEGGLLKLTALNNFGCTVTDEILIREQKSIIPTVLKSGDELKIKYLPVNCALLIFNSLGQLIYVNHNYNNDYRPFAARGIYYIVLNTGIHTYTSKLLILD